MRAAGRLGDFRPLTFVERGVAVAFTTPLLTGTRARPASHGIGVELMIPNPSGSRGYYVTPWHGIADLCSPTVHDRLLIERVSALPVITPRAIARVVRDIAEIGTAGDEVREAARQAAKLDHDTRTLVNFNLLMELIRQVEPGAVALAEQGDSEELKARAHAAMGVLVPALGCPANKIADHLEALSELFMPLGLVDTDVGSRMRRTLRNLTELRDAAVAWAASQEDSTGEAALMISAVATLTIDCAQHTMDEARAQTAQLPALLSRWINRPAEVQLQITRTEWLLDGWEQICLIWQVADTEAERRRALLEIAPLMPVVPKEALDWVNLPENTMPLLRRQVRLNEDWRTGAIVFEELVERNEKILALSL